MTDRTARLAAPRTAASPPSAADDHRTGAQAALSTRAASSASTGPSTQRASRA